MPVSMLLEGGKSTYNVGVVQESNTLTTASQQYWAQRQAKAAIQLTRVQMDTAASTADHDWKKFSAKGTAFLEYFLQKALDRSERPLRAHWQDNKRIAKEAIQLFRRGVAIDLLLPFSGAPLRFLRSARRSTEYVIDATNVFDDTQQIEIGKPYITVSYKGDCLFAITPSFGYMEIKTYFIDNPDWGKWSSDQVFPMVFADVAKEFTSELKAVESNFTPLLKLCMEKDALEKERSTFQRMQCATEAWSIVHIPEPQKLELLRAFELFESCDAAAPRGLLLTGPSGVGKSLLGKTIAETVGCSFQHLTPASLKLEHLGGSGRRVHEIWEEARQNQPSILYLDECEGVLARRGSAETDVISTEIVQAFLAEWDGLDKSNRILVIGATNRRDLLDDAILSRFGWEMEIKLPSEEDRISILQQELTVVGVEVALPAEFGALTQGMSGRDLQEVAKTARRISHPESPTVEQLREALSKLRKGRNTRVNTQSKWENLVLDQKTTGRLKLICGLLQDVEKWSAQGVSISRALLLEGPPGTGKTEIGRTLANESGLAFYAATTADLKANYLGQSGNRVKQLFERARSHSPCILFLDELDIVVPDRSHGGDDPLTREIVGQLLQEIDGVQSYSEHVFLVGATNRPNAVDAAILSRFTERLSIPLPDRAARVRLLSIFLNSKKLGFPLDDVAILLADLSEGKGFSGRDLRNWVATGEQNALLRAMEDGGPENFVITLDDLSSLS
jgi:SpoVK/Ycf46/Vps4 family AAA+-type ATPase